MGICSRNTCGPGVLASPTLTPLYLDQRVVNCRRLNPCADAGELGEEGLAFVVLVTPPGRVGARSPDGSLKLSIGSSPWSDMAAGYTTVAASWRGLE
eukprot:3647648-Amphidinium_carterae.2